MRAAPRQSAAYARALLQCSSRSRNTTTFSRPQASLDLVSFLQRLGFCSQAGPAPQGACSFLPSSSQPSASSALPHTDLPPPEPSSFLKLDSALLGFCSLFWEGCRGPWWQVPQTCLELLLPLQVEQELGWGGRMVREVQQAPCGHPHLLRAPFDSRLSESHYSSALVSRISCV